MKKNTFRVLSKHFLFLTTILALSLPGFAQDPVRVLVVDGPVELENEKLREAIDLKAMDTLMGVDSDGKPVSWRELNSLKMGLLRAQMSSERFQSEAKFLDATGCSPQEMPFGTYFSGLFKYAFIRGWATELKNFTILALHGTSVSGLIAQDNIKNKLRLITYPLAGETKRILYTEEDLENPERTFRRENKIIEDVIASISKGIRDHGIQVVNLSIGQDTRNSKTTADFYSDSAARSSHKKELKKLAVDLAQSFREGMRQLFLNHPNTIFVLAAGNENRNLDSEKEMKKYHLSTLKAPNLIVVGALDEKGELSSFSNYGNKSVNVLAQGKHIKSLCLGGGVFHANGTSEAAPIVANQIAEIRFQNPELDSETVIQKFYAEKTKRYYNLIGKVENERYLPLNEKLGFVDSGCAEQDIKKMRRTKTKHETSFELF